MVLAVVLGGVVIMALTGIPSAKGPAESGSSLAPTETSRTSAYPASGVGDPGGSVDDVPRTAVGSSNPESGVPERVSTVDERPRAGGRRVIAERTLLTGDRIAIVASSTGNRSITVSEGGPVHLVQTPERRFAIPGGLQHDRFDRSLFALDTVFPAHLLPGNHSDRTHPERRASAGETAGDESPPMPTRSESPSVPAGAESNTVPVLLHTDVAPRAVRAAGFESATELSSSGVVAAEYDPTREARPIDALQQRGTVERVTLDRRLKLPAPRLPGQDVSTLDVNATGENVSVAVLDTGIDATHPDLEDRVVHRHEIVENGSVLDPSGHGTAVAGIIAGTGNASDGRRTGLAPEADLIDVRVADRNAYGTISELIAGIEYTVEETDADVITMSLETVSRDRELATAIDWAIDRGVVVLTAGGNQGEYRSIDQTGTPEDVITVGATGREVDSVASFSSHGPTGDGRVKPDLVAPGENVPTLAPDSGDPGGQSTDQYTEFSGTSASAPYAAGAVALLLDRDPALTVDELHSRLGSTATPLPDADAFEQGSGRIDVQDALDPHILVDEPVVNPGVLEPDETVRRQIRFENPDERPHQFSLDPTLEHVDSGGDASDRLSMNRSEITLAPGETTTVEIEIEAPTETGLYAGFLHYTVDGERRSIALGFVRGGLVTIEKRTLTRDESVDGTFLLLFSEDLTHTGSVTFEDGNATFVSGGGTYYFVSGRTDGATGTTVLMHEKRELEGSERIVLDERETVPARMDVEPIADAYGPLANVTVTASLTSRFGGRTTRWNTAAENAASRKVRVSPSQNAEFARTALLVPETQQGDGALDAADVFHLGYGTVGTETIGEDRPRVWPGRLATVRHRYYRASRDDSYSLTPRARVQGVRTHQPAYDFEIGDRRQQRVHRLIGDTRYRYEFEGEDWRAVGSPDEDVHPGPRFASPGVQSTRTVREHPLFASIGLHTPSRPYGGGKQTSSRVERPGADERLAIDGRPFSDGEYLEIERATARSSLSVRVNGSLTNETSGSWSDARIDTPVDPGDNVTISLSGRTSDATLSSNTATSVSIDGYDPDGPGPPLITELSFEEPTDANAIRDPARLRIRGTGFHRTPVTRVWYAAGAPEEPPWGSEAGWISASTSRDGGDVLADLDLDDPRLDFDEHEPTVSVAASFESWDGHRVRTVTTDAAHAGKSPDFSTVDVQARILDHEGQPAAGDTVLIVDEQRDVVLTGNRVGAEGHVSFTVPKNRTYSLRHRRTDLRARGRTGSDASRPAITALDRVTVTDHRDLGTYRLPAANETRVTVFDQRGRVVPDATVSFVHRSRNASARYTLQANENGTVVPGGPGGPGLPLAGEVEVVATPPGGATALSGESGNRTLRIDRDTVATVLVPNRPPEVDLVVNDDTLTSGESVVVTVVERHAPAPIDSYEWNLTDLGAGPRTTDRPMVGVTPTTSGTVELSVTGVDELGNRDTARLSLTVEPDGESPRDGIESTRARP
jgi:hypothetical protein